MPRPSRRALERDIPPEAPPCLIPQSPDVRGPRPAVPVSQHPGPWLAKQNGPSGSEVDGDSAPKGPPVCARPCMQPASGLLKPLP